MWIGNFSTNPLLHVACSNMLDAKEEEKVSLVDKKTLAMTQVFATSTKAEVTVSNDYLRWVPGCNEKRVNLIENKEKNNVSIMTRQEKQK